jgi:hypothetical protein
MLGTHPDIAFAVTKMSQYVANPTKEHYDKALYICHYLVSTADYSLVYGKDQTSLIAYADSDWATDPHSRHLVTSHLVLLGGTAVSWNSRAQKTCVLSSTKAEYMALSDACRQLVWMCSLLWEMRIFIYDIPLCGDNQGSIFLASNTVQEKRTKHIDLCCHYIREVVDQCKVKIYFVPMDQNPADMFTKNLTRDKFLYCRSTLGIHFEDGT